MFSVNEHGLPSFTITGTTPTGVLDVVPGDDGLRLVYRHHGGTMEMPVKTARPEVDIDFDSMDQEELSDLFDNKAYPPSMRLRAMTQYMMHVPGGHGHLIDEMRRLSGEIRDAGL